MIGQMNEMMLHVTTSFNICNYARSEIKLFDQEKGRTYSFKLLKQICIQVVVLPTYLQDLGPCMVLPLAILNRH